MSKNADTLNPIIKAKFKKFMKETLKAILAREAKQS